MDRTEFIEEYYVDRRDSGSVKWDGMNEMFTRTDLFPLWIADMDFKVSKAIRDALQKEIDFGVFGYKVVPDSYYEAYLNWMKEKHDVKLDKDWLRFTSGIVAAIYNCVNVYTEENDSILIFTPVYYPFHNAVIENNRRLVTSDLEIEDGRFVMNFDKFEQQIIDEDVKMLIFCSPHNPAARVWTEEELEKVLEICAKHQVLVLSDEIHSEFVFGDHRYIPTMKVAGGKYQDNIITFNSTTKAFNIAGLPVSNVIIVNDALREIYDKYEIQLHLSPNPFALMAAEAAYREGSEWLEHINGIVYDNAKYIEEKLAPFEEVTVFPLEGTYLLFIDISFVKEYCSMTEFLEDRCQIAIDYGEWFGSSFEGFIRINLATSHENIEKATQILMDEFNKLKQ